MAFEDTKKRSVSFGVATSIPFEIIETLWDLLDNYLKTVVQLDSILSFHLKNNHNNIAIEYFNSNQNLSITFDYNFPFDEFFPSIVYIMDQAGMETLLLPYELD